MLEFEEVKHPEAKLTIIWLHGLGASGHDFMPLVPQLHAAGIAANFIFPHAPVQPVTLNGGMQMRSWYDIYALSSMDKEDVAGVQQSVAAVHELIEAQGDSTKVLLAGFSQGGATAIAAALTYSKPLAGLIALSTYPATAESWLGNNLKQAKDLPIMLGHGDWDPVLPPVLGHKAKEYLDRWGYHPKWHTYPMGHELCAEEIVDIKNFLAQDIAA